MLRRAHVRLSVHVLRRVRRGRVGNLRPALNAKLMWYAPGVRNVKSWSSRRKVSVRVNVKPVVTRTRRVQKRAAIRVERVGRAVRGVVLNANHDVSAVQKVVHRVGVDDAFVGCAMRTLQKPSYAITRLRSSSAT